MAKYLFVSLLFVLLLFYRPHAIVRLMDVVQQAPGRMRSVSQASNLLTNALGSWLTIPLVYLVNANPNHPWITTNIDDGELTYYYLLLAGFMVLSVMALMYISRNFEYADPEVLIQLDAEAEGDSVEQSLLKKGDYAESDHAKSRSGGRHSSDNSMPATGDPLLASEDRDSATNPVH